MIESTALLHGIWRSILSGTDEGSLTPVETRFVQEIELRGNGTADWRYLSNEFQPEEPAPIPTTWTLENDAVLVLWIPVPPMPEYGMESWDREELRYDVLEVTKTRLTLSDRPYDGEFITVFERRTGSLDS